MRPLGPPPRAPAWQRSLAFVVAGIVLFAWLPLWAAVLLTSATVGLVLAGPIVAARRRARPRSIDVGQAASLLGTIDERQQRT